MILGAQVEMEGYFFILFLGVAFICGMIFVGYFQESKGITCQLTQDYLTGQFIISEYEKEVEYNFADPNNLEVDANLVIEKKQIILTQKAIDETARVQKLIDDGNIKLYPIINPYKDLN